jgi:hypothetical protein
MDYAERDATLDSIRLMFGAEGAIAFIDYRKGLADPADFSMNVAVLHIQARLGLSAEELKPWRRTQGRTGLPTHSIEASISPLCPSIPGHLTT